MNPNTICPRGYNYELAYIEVATVGRLAGSVMKSQFIFFCLSHNIKQELGWETSSLNNPVNNSGGLIRSRISSRKNLKINSSRQLKIIYSKSHPPPPTLIELNQTHSHRTQLTQLIRYTRSLAFSTNKYGVHRSTYFEVVTIASSYTSLFLIGAGIICRIGECMPQHPPTRNTMSPIKPRRIYINVLSMTNSSSTWRSTQRDYRVGTVFTGVRGAYDISR